MRIDARALAVHACATFALATVASCGDSSTSAAPMPLTVWVLDERAFVGDVERPIPGASVFFDPPGGGARIEGRSDVDGRFVFEGDFTLGGAVVSAISSEHALVTKLDVRPDTIAARPNRSGKPAGDLVVLLPRFDAAQATLALHGRITGKKDPASSVDLSVTGQRRRGSTITTEATYALSAPSQRPFVLVGHESKKVTNTFGLVINELLSSFRIDSEGGKGDVTLDVDIATATPLPRRTTTVRLLLPSEAGSPFGDDARGSAIVTSVDSQILLGAIGKVARASDGRAFDVELGVVDVAIAPERPVTRAVLAAPDGSRSVRVEPGVAADGTTFGDFLLPPTVPEASRSLADPIPLAGVPPGADLRIDIVAGGQLVWIVESPPGGLRGESLKLPEALGLVVLPTDVQVFGVTLTALADRVPLEPHGELHRRSSVSREILVRRR